MVKGRSVLCRGRGEVVLSKPVRSRISVSLSMTTAGVQIAKSASFLSDSRSRQMS